MTNEPTSTPNYIMGYGDEFQKALQRRTAEANAFYLLPHVKPGMRLLDFGCGPGTISVGLAKAIEPGEFHGIDMEESQIEIARASAKAGGHDNATFHVGGASNLPFDDDFFDVAHCHTVMNHVPDTQKLLTEIKRVLKPGGTLGSRELISSSIVMGPDFKLLGDAWKMFGKRFDANDGHGDMGSELKSALAEAGFSIVHASASFNSYSSDDDRKIRYDSFESLILDPETIQSDIDSGLATSDQFIEWRSALDAWWEHPGSFAAASWGEAIGRKP
jgi:ubiquinone/menaquinone biosynthesis C-methylase UbiE